MNDSLDTSHAGLPQQVYSVSSLVRETKSLLELEFGTVWVEGEISNLAKPSSGHRYFTLKDEKAQVRCALFRGQRTRIEIEPDNGMLVRVMARVSLYEPRGDFQLIVNTLEPAGAGALQQAFEALKLKLLNEGLFDAEHKQPLPSFPRRVGVITSPSGAVIHDILTTLKRRFPAIEVVLLPVPVQGREAAPKIVEALQLAEAHGQLDALILARGGGSLEDLWPFNEEAVARALFACRIPVVSSIGHETDITISDFIADVRAPTPTAAAEILSPDARELVAVFSLYQARLARTMRDRISQNAQALDLTARRLRHPGQRIVNARRQLEALAARAERAVRQHIRLRRMQFVPVAKRMTHCNPEQRIQALGSSFESLAMRLLVSTRNTIRRNGLMLSSLGQRLNTLSPLETLGRGFAIFYQNDGKTIIDRVAKARPGDRGMIRVADGEIHCLIEGTRGKN